MLHRTWRLLGIGALAVSLSSCSPDTALDDSQIPGWVDGYVKALNERDEPGLKALLNNAAWPNDAADRIAKYGAKGLSVERVTTSSDYAAMRNVRVDVTPGGESPLEIILVWESGRFSAGPLRVEQPVQGPTGTYADPVAPTP